MTDPLSFDALIAQLDSVTSWDRAGLLRRLRRWQHGGGKDRNSLEHLAQDIAAATTQLQLRQQNLPTPQYDSSLPILERREEILGLLGKHQVMILCGETGSGKSTQLPKLCLELGRGVKGLIGHTQPRRLAARSIAERLSQELHSPLGQQVGYKVRFKDHVSPNSYVKVMTDGILLAETQTDRLLHHYDTVIIDEAHERSLNIDFLLGYLKHILPRRPDLKLIITSATIDPQRFSRFFSDAPIMEVSGRSYPVEIRYRPITASDTETKLDVPQSIAQAIDELHQAGTGDVLVFLPGERDIRETAETLRKHHPPQCEILPLYARLSIADQQRIFAPHSGTRIVLATNVAETSITVPGIRYVVDAGLARLSRYSYRNKIQRLPVEKIAQANAQQRAGRCGRVSAGICIRLYDEMDFAARPAFTDPEILRTNLASVILQLHSLQLGSIERFEFLDRPEDKSIRDGYRVLEEIGAMQAQRLTAIGKQLARLPLDPRLGRILVAARQYQCLSEALIIVSALSVPDPRERPHDKQQRAQLAHAQFTDEQSDFVGLLKLWQFYTEQRQHLSKNKLRKLCTENFLSASRMAEWRDIYVQLHGVLREQGAQFNQQPADYANMHKALLSGMASQIGMRDETRTYQGPRGIKFQIFPGSALAKKGPKWLMAGAMVETSQLFAHQVAAIEPEWVEEVAANVIKHHYFDPRWHASTAQVGGYETTSLYGLVLCAKRRINYGPHEPELAREIFIREALVEGNFKTRAAFLGHNQQLIADIHKLEHKSRRPDILVDATVLYGFYDRQIPAGIYSGPHFESWYNTAVQQTPRLLFLTNDDIMQHDAQSAGVDQFPDSIRIHDLRIPLSYHLAPGETDDGVTARIPLTILSSVQESAFSWLVPGLRHEKLVALIKSLPKALRKNFVPAPEYARAALDELKPGDQSFLQATAKELQRISGVPVDASQWDETALPLHLQMRFVIVDKNDKPLADGRNLKQLKSRLAIKTQHTFDTQVRWPLPQGEHSDWPIDAIPTELVHQQNGLIIKGYPALVAEHERLGLKVFPDPTQAIAAHRSGLLLLLHIRLGKELKYLGKNLPHLQQSCMCLVPRLDCASITTDILDTALQQVFLDRPGLNYYLRSDFEKALAQGRGEFVSIANQIAEQLSRVATAYQQVRQLLNKPALAILREDIEQQLTMLIYPGFIHATPLPWRDYLPRYLKGIQLRLDKALHDVRRDQLKFNELQPHWQRYAQYQIQAEKQITSDAELQTYHWMLEEFRILLFAQELKAAIKISAQRLEEQWRKIPARN